MNLFDQINWPPPGRYVVALSGGVDSVVLLHLLAHHGQGLELVAAYVNHGWRDTQVDQAVVHQLTEQVGIELRIERLALKGRSEAEARQARYAVLENVRERTQSRAIITAHHLDDRIETVALNLLRGTGRQGLSGLRSGRGVIRPLLPFRKSELVAYARQHGLGWVEDPTNSDLAYRRNWVRHELLAPHPDLQAALLAGMERAAALNDEIDRLLAARLAISSQNLGHDFMVPWANLKNMSMGVLQEALVYLGRRLDPAAEFNERVVEQLALNLKSQRLRGDSRLAQRLFVRFQHGTVTIEFKAQ